ncbi:MAG: hypothetical protein KME19_12065 [Microcoleus vaginatus WJT46-NPBG5]|nr:hypothetical protein [Microcoleus vaginatus WJT46-NPBG5]
MRGIANQSGRCLPAFVSVAGEGLPAESVVSKTYAGVRPAGSKSINVKI